MIKIAYCNRPDYDNPLGGDAIQMLKTKEYVEKINKQISIDIITSPNLLNKDYSLVHIFNYYTVGITNSFFVKAKELNLPIVSSSIYWDYQFVSSGPLFLFGYPCFISRNLLRCLSVVAKITAMITNHPTLESRRFKKYLTNFVKMSDMVLPNSSEEGDLLLRFTNLKDQKEKIHVVYNGVEIKSEGDFTVRDEEVIEKYNLPSDYILQVGRIEFCKGQLNLVSALMDTPNIPIVFVGKPDDKLYYKKLKQVSELRGNVFFVNAVPHSEVGAFYRKAAVHVLPSLRESPGLVSLESQYYGCPIVVSSEEFAPVNTYFSNVPYVMDPLDKKSIKDTVCSAFKERKTVAFNSEKFSWDNVARQTCDAYHKIISE